MILSLLKVNLAATLAGILKRRRSGKKVSVGVKILVGFLILYVAAAFFTLFYIICSAVCAPFFGAGIGWFYFTLVGIIIFALCFITCVFTVQAQIFGAKDNDLLLSMPVRPSAILVSRVLSMLVVEYVFEVLVLIPAVIVWCAGGFATAAGGLILLLSALLLPLFAMSPACLVGWLVALVSSRMRNKNIITLVLSMAFLAAYFWFFGRLQNTMAYLLENGAQMADAVRRSFFPAYYFGAGAADGSLVSFLIFALCALAPFIVMCALLSKNFISIATANRGAAKIKYHERALKASGVRAALVKKELRHFFNNPMIILNAALGSIAMALLAILVAVRPSVVMGTLDSLMPMLPGLSYAVVACVALSLLCSFVTLSAALISLEGKSLWLVRSLPVTARDALEAKVLTHVAVSGGPALLASVVCAVRLGGTPLQLLALLVTPAAFSVFIGLGGVSLNLLMPNFDWKNELQPVKQSVAVLITMFGSLALVAALFLVYVFLAGSAVPMEVYALIVTAALAIASRLLRAWLLGRGARRFEAL